MGTTDGRGRDRRGLPWRKKGNKHVGKRRNYGSQGKTEVIGAIARKGNVVARWSKRPISAPMTISSKRQCRKSRLIATDESFRYRHLNQMRLKHDFVTHKADEYVRGKVHTQTIESFWSLLRRGIMGSYHKVSKDYFRCT